MDLSAIQPFLDWLYTHQQWVAGAIFLIAFLESLALAGVVIPGVLLLFGASAVAGSGILNIWQALACAFAGAVLGDCTSFFLGKSLKQQIKHIWPFRNYPEWIGNGEAFFARHGGKSIVIGRFVGPIRPVIPLVAGMLDMRSGRFVSINFISALAWAPTYVIPGFLFGASIHWEFPEGYSRLFAYLGVIALAGFVITKLSHWHLSPESRLYRALHRWAERQKHVRLFWHWLAEPRGEDHTFPLSGILLLLASLLGLVLIAYLVKTTDTFTTFNQQIFAFFQTIKHPWFDAIFAVITTLGHKSHIRIVAGILVLWLIYKKQFAAALVCVATVLLAEKTAGILKDSMEIARPLLDDEGLPRLSSFPSGHVTRATVLFGLFTSFIAQELHHGRRWWVYGIALMPMLLVAASRLYLQQHWVTDVSAGMLLGFSLCAMSRIVLNRFDRRPLQADISFFIALGLALCASIIYVQQHYPEVMAWIQA